MRRRSSPFLEGVRDVRKVCVNGLAFLIALAALAWGADARAQSCCAGGSALTPGRLAPHETFLAGMQARASNVFASFDADGHYATPPPGTTELDLEQDLFAAVRFLGRAQAAVLVPLVETHRQTRANGAEFGGGVGDVNVSARYDFTLAGASKVVPGIGLLAGLTVPTGTAPDAASHPLATDATGIGAFQGNLGLALEQTYGPWLVNATVLVAKRAARNVQGIHSLLGTQTTALLAGGYTFSNEAAIVLVGSFTVEGNATVDGEEQAKSSRRILTASVAGLLPLNDHVRLTGSVFMNPPVPMLGRNLPATAGLTLGAVYAWF
jgi:hypothetical protein